MPGLAWLGILLALGQTAQTDFQVGVNLVRVPCVVTDRNGAPVRDLRREDFTLRDEGVPETIKYFWREVDLPLTVGLIVDVSGSQRSLVHKHRETVAQFFRQVMGPRDRGFLVTVGPQARLVTDLTGSTAELLGGVDRIVEKQQGELLGGPCRATRRRRARQLGIRGCGGTALWHGVYYAAKLKMKPLEGRKALVVISDGADTGSDRSLTDAIEAAQGADTLVYTIKYVSPLGWVALGPMLRGRHSLLRLAEETGGYAFSGARQSLADIFTRIEGELRSQYVLAFTPADKSPAEGPRKLEVVVGRPGLSIRARETYFPRDK